MVAALATTTLGNTDLVTTTFGLGCGPIAKRSFATGVATVQRALELGVRYFDTSPLYGKGVSQAILGTALLEYETLSGDEVDAVLRGEAIVRPEEEEPPKDAGRKASVPSSGKAKDHPGGGFEPEPQPES